MLIRIRSHTCYDIPYQSGDPSVSLNEFKIFGKGFNNNRVKSKISEALLIKQYRSTLNTQENSISLELFN